MLVFCTVCMLVVESGFATLSLAISGLIKNDDVDYSIK